jgi:Ca2+-binding EF-hand superfamily protein
VQADHRADRWGDRMAKIDKNGDGVISDEERAAGMKARAEMMRKRLDADGDGKLTPAELTGARSRMRFEDPAALDTDHDGDISVDELLAGMKARADKRRAEGGGSGGSGATP